MNRGVSVGLVVAVLASSSLFGCKDQAKCDEALATARKSMQDEFLDMALARQWRDHAGKTCGAGPEVDALDKEIVAKEAAIVKAAEDKAKAEADAGKAAIERAGKIWSAFDKAQKDEKDEDKSKSALKKAKKKADKLVKGLTPAYGKQVLDYNKKAYKKRQKALAD